MRITGIVFIAICPISLINYYFDLALEIEGSKVPSDWEFAVLILIIGIFLSMIGWFLDKYWIQKMPSKK